MEMRSLNVEVMGGRSTQRAGNPKAQLLGGRVDDGLDRVPRFIAKYSSTLSPFRQRLTGQFRKIFE